MLSNHLHIALVKTAHFVAEDQTREKLTAFVKNARVKIAKAIEPKTEADTKWIDDYFKSASK